MTTPTLSVYRTLSEPLAQALMAVARAEVNRRHLSMFVALVDAGGAPLLVERINDAQPASFDVALAKAGAAVGFRRPTKAFEGRIVAEGRTNLLSMPGLVAVEGGIPFVCDGRVVGAVGVSGGTGVEDGEVGAVVVAEFTTLTA